jgi:hypothetical protein
MEAKIAYLNLLNADTRMFEAGATTVRKALSAAKQATKDGTAADTQPHIRAAAQALGRTFALIQPLFDSPPPSTKTYADRLPYLKGILEAAVSFLDAKVTSMKNRGVATAEFERNIARIREQTALLERMDQTDEGKQLLGEAFQLVEDTFAGMGAGKRTTGR